jgi:putative ABC transport system permease protein
MGQARRELEAIGARRAAMLPDTNRDWGVTVRTLHDQTVGKIRPGLLLLAGGVGLVLLMACVNVANVLLARSTSRAQGLAIRAALGASRRRLVQQALVESTALAVTGGVAGTGVLALITRTLVAISPRDLPRISETGTGTAVVRSRLAGLSPRACSSARCRRGQRRSARAILSTRARATTSRARHRIRSTLIVAEVTMAVALAIGTGLLLRSFAAVLHVDPGFDGDHLLTFQMNAPARLQTPARSRLLR